MSRLSAFISAQKKQIIVILMAFFYCIVSYQFFIYTDGFNPFYLKQFPIVHRYIGIAILSSCFFISAIFVFFQDMDWKTKLKVIFEVNVISFFSFLYYAINSRQSFPEIIFLGQTLKLSTGIVAVPLVFLIFLTVKNSLFQRVNNTFLLLLQVLLLFLSLFSIDDILVRDKSDFRGFNNIWFSTLFSIRSEVWTFLGLSLISLLTIFWLKLKVFKAILIQCFVFFLINLEVLFISKMIVIRSFDFWHKALLMIIFWDLFYYLFRVLNKNSPSSDLQLRINLSFFYHLIL